MGQLILRCPKTGHEFDSGFVLETSDHRGIPPTVQWRLRCKICLEAHEFRIVDGRVGDKNSLANVLARDIGGKPVLKS